MAKKKATYVDGFVLVVPKKKLDAYRKMASEACKVWKKHGALDYKECLIDDAKPKFATFLFPKMVKAKPSETVWFSYIEFKSKAHRDQVNAKVMKDPRLKEMCDINAMPFDARRMFWGGFKVIV